MNILHLFGKRLSNGAKINTMNVLTLSEFGVVTKRDWELLEKFRKNNAKNSAKRKCKERDQYH